MGSGVPLLNEYKQEFFLKRLPQTILGGLKIKLGYEAPFYVYVSQIVLFVVPWLLGGIFTALVEYDVLTFDLGAYVYGSLMFLLVLGCQILSTVMASQRSKSVLVKEKPSLLAEEDEVDFFSCCGPETVSFVIVPKKHKLNILLHSAVSGLMCGVGLWYLLPKTLNSLYNFNLGATVILYTLGWLTLCISQYPLTSCAPPEPARYRALDTYELSSLVRPFYMMVCQAFFIAAKYMGMTELMLADQILHVVFVCLPVVWTLGLLPPLDALLFWAVEQFSVLFLGGSPTSTDVWSVVMVFVSVGALLAVHFLPVCSASVVVAAVFGYILSIDLGGYVSSLFPACRKKNRVSSSEYHNPSEQKLRSFSWGKLILYFLYHFIMAGSAVAISLCLLLYKNSLHPDSWRIMGYVVVGLLVLEKFLRDFQGVYVVFGLWRNPLFCYHSVYRKQLFCRRKKLGHILLLILGVLRRAIVNFVAPVVMLSYLCLAGGFVSAVTTVSCHSGRTISAAAWLSISINRAFRSVWQSTVDALLEISIAHIIMIALPSVMADQSLGLFNLLLIISFARDRFYQILDKLWFYFTLLIMAWKDKKQRRRSSLAIILMNVLLFPVVLGVVVVSAALSAPLLPLFTLPIVLMGFPRPVRSWPSAVGASANQCPDTVFYKQLTRNLTTAMKAAFANGSLGEPRPGSHYLLRFQDRMIWVMVLERGAAYCRLSIKGLELQETSCHSVEATRVDDMFDSTFESETGFPLCSFNQYPLHTLTPCDTLSLKTYSDARNILTGIIDSPDNHKFVFAVFPKVLVWVLLKEVFKINFKKNERTNSENNLDELKQISRKDSWSNNNNKEFSPKDTVVTIGASNTFRGVSPSPIVQELDDYEWADSRPNSARAASRKPSLSDSFQSFTSILSNDDHPIEMNRVKPVSKKKSSRANVRKSSDSIEELGFGLPAVDPRTKPKSPHSVPFQVSGKAGNSIYRPVTNLAGSAEFTTPHSRQLSLPAKWRELPVEESRVRKMSADFPADWYRGLIATLGLSAAHLASENVAAEVAKDDVLLTIYSQLTMACCGVFDPSVGGGGGTSHLYKCYRGDVPWNAMLDWLTEDKTLFGLVLQAYRYSFKLMLDQCVLGEITDDSELVEYLEEYDSDWYIGLDSDPEWNTAVLNNKPSLFSVGHASHQGTYSSRVVTLQDTAVHVGRLNAEAVRGQWANLSLELLYFTNDDEERYSIQAHPALLRNLTVQAADPPLGYPIYSSAPTSLSLL